ncbi:hypothetical protein C0989_008544, partial [Termitomyces sp. Mn162]
MDGLSRREKQPGDEEYAPVDQSLLDDPKPMIFEYPDEINKVPGWEEHVPLKLEDFIDQIDTRGGYLLATSPEDVQEEVKLGRDREQGIGLKLQEK